MLIKVFYLALYGPFGGTFVRLMKSVEVTGFVSIQESNRMFEIVNFRMIRFCVKRAASSTFRFGNNGLGKILTVMSLPRDVENGKLQSLQRTADFVFSDYANDAIETLDQISNQYARQGEAK